MTRALFFIPLALALAACGTGDNAELDELDARLGNKADADPSLTAALEDQIMVDPSLSQQANEDAIRPAERPVQTPVPPGMGGPERTDPGRTLGALAQKQAEISRDRFNGCRLDVDYAAGWAARLPAELPLYPNGRVVEAAGSNEGDCRLRAVTYMASANPATVAKFYTILGDRAGFKTGTTSEDGEAIVSGWRPSDGAAFYAIVTPQAEGSSADFVSNRGR
jgi:hypothetical protein